MSRLTRREILLLPLALSLSACGGGSDNYESANLYGAYEAISWGMSYQLVRSIIGKEPVSQQVEGSSIILYRWEDGRGTYLFTTLLIQIDYNDGMVGKIITGPKGNHSETLDPTTAAAAQ